MQHHERLRRSLLLTLIATTISWAPVDAASTAQLIMVEEDGCVFCQRFNREIAPAYPKTAEGKRAPLRRVELTEPWPDDLRNIKPTTITPTFILINNGKEMDRLYGYPGDQYFWFLLGQMLDKI